MFHVRGYNRVGYLLWGAHHRWPNPLTWLAYWTWHRWVLRYFWYEPSSALRAAGDRDRWGKG